jgi:hypothetical protein
VTTFTKGGLTNGTPYFFITRAISPGGNFLVYSNEATATPASAGRGGASGSGGTGLIISGFAYPNAKVTVVRDSVAVSQITANSSGSFQAFYSLTPGTYNFIVYANDKDGRKSANLSFQATVSLGVVSNITNLVLSPTITSDYSIIKQGENLTFSGFAQPNAPVTILIVSDKINIARNTTSGNDGKYTYVFNTAGYEKVTYTARAYSVFNSIQSLNSLPVSFTIGDRSVLRVPVACGARSDLNCDGAVDLIDFSILLYYWDSTEFAANPRVDIDGSGKVGLVDFSIMLYDWTG